MQEMITLSSRHGMAAETMGRATQHKLVINKGNWTNMGVPWLVPCPPSLPINRPLHFGIWEGLPTQWRGVFFSSSLADVALWLGPYMSISSKTSICTRTKRVRKCRQITTNQTTHRPARRPANPPARLAFRQEKQQTRHTKGAGAQTKNTHQKDLPKDTVV